MKFRIIKKNEKTYMIEFYSLSELEWQPFGSGFYTTEENAKMELEHHIEILKNEREKNKNVVYEVEI